MRVIVLCDLAERPPQDQNYSEDLKSDEWESEADVVGALGRLGHEARIFGVYDNIDMLVDETRKSRPDLIFNLSESFAGDRSSEPHLPSLLELLKLNYTGAKPAALHLCKDKALAKKIVSHHGVRIPRFEVSRRSQPLQRLKNFVYPAFVKPIGLEASAGISQDSFVANERDCLDRVRFIHESVGHDAIIEEYIEGRELYVSVLGNERLEVFPPRELFFEAIPEGDPKFATFKAKWDDNYRKRWGIEAGPAKPLPPGMDEQIVDTAKRIFRSLQITGYCRIDLRLTPQGELVFLEANPNPSIAEQDDFAQSAVLGGLTYDKLIGKIIKLSL